MRLGDWGTLRAVGSPKGLVRARHLLLGWAMRCLRGSRDRHRVCGERRAFKCLGWRASLVVRKEEEVCTSAESALYVCGSVEVRGGDECAKDLCGGPKKCAKEVAVGNKRN